MNFFGKEKNRLRHARKREKDMGEKAGELDATRLETLQYNGIGATCDRLVQYPTVILPWMVADDHATTASGARAPISGIVSSASRNVQTHRLEMYRCRMRMSLEVGRKQQRASWFTSRRNKYADMYGET